MQAVFRKFAAIELSLESGTRKKLIILVIALMTRLILSYIFLGSIDTINTIKNSVSYFNEGHLFTNIPYFPVIPIFFWLGGLINTATELPLAFCYRIIPAIHDALIAVLIYSIVEKRDAGKAFKAGLLYALAPVAVIINSLHGQWDSICLFYLILSFYIRDFFRNSYSKYYVFGILFGFSFLIKPMSLIFLPIFLQPMFKVKKSNLWKYCKNQLLSIAGLLTILAVCFGIFRYSGYDIADLTERVLFYSNKGIQIFGLRFTEIFSKFAFLETRFWIIGVIVYISIYYHFRKIQPFNVILFSFALILGMAGLAPQYLIWIVPFLLIMRKFMMSALYNLPAVSFLLLYYINPLVSPLRFENMAVFAALNDFKWLMPPLYLTEERFIPIIRILGNYFIPLCSLFIALHIIYRVMKKVIKKLYSRNIEKSGELQKVNISIKKERSRLLVFKNGYLLFIMIFWLLTLTLYILLNNKVIALKDSLINTIDKKLAEYNIIGESISNSLIGIYERLSINNTFNIIYLIFIFAFAWSIYSFIIGFRRIENVRIKLQPDTV